MTGNERPPPKPPARGDEAATAEATREVIRSLAETPPVKTIADVKAASEIYEANAQKTASGKLGEAAKDNN